MQAKLITKAATTTLKTILSTRSEARITKSMPKDQLLLRYQTRFALEIEGMKPLEKFSYPKFNMYDGKSNLRSHISHFQ